MIKHFTELWVDLDLMLMTFRRLTVCEIWFSYMGFVFHNLWSSVSSCNGGWPFGLQIAWWFGRLGPSSKAKCYSPTMFSSERPRISNFWSSTNNCTYARACPPSIWGLFSDSQIYLGELLCLFLQCRKLADYPARPVDIIIYVASVACLTL